MTNISKDEILKMVNSTVNDIELNQLYQIINIMLSKGMDIPQYLKLPEGKIININFIKSQNKEIIEEEIYFENSCKKLETKKNKVKSYAYYDSDEAGEDEAFYDMTKKQYSRYLDHIEEKNRKFWETF